MKKGRCISRQLAAIALAPFGTRPTATTGERDLRGIAFDPDFASNLFVHLYSREAPP